MPENVKSISDIGLMAEADKIFKQQEMCGPNTSTEIVESLKKRFSEILTELNSREIYHPTQKRENIMSQDMKDEICEECTCSSKCKDGCQCSCEIGCDCKYKN